MIAVTPKPVGRPTKLTPKLQEQICDSLLSGAYVETAAMLTMRWSPPWTRGSRNPRRD